MVMYKKRNKQGRYINFVLTLYLTSTIQDEKKVVLSQELAYIF